MLAAILAIASAVLGALAPPAAMLAGFDVALGISSAGGHYVHHGSDFLISQAILLSGAVVGILALTLRPRRFRSKLYAAVGIALSLGAAVELTRTYWG